MCLVFLETQFEALADKLGDDHIAEVLAKTLAKMSPAACRIAEDLGLSPRAAVLLEKAVNR